METLLALLLVNLFDSNVEYKPQYKVNNCYSSLSEYRPSIVLITAIEDSHYRYIINKTQFKQSFKTIETIYHKQVTCPKEI